MLNALYVFVNIHSICYWHCYSVNDFFSFQHSAVHIDSSYLYLINVGLYMCSLICQYFDYIKFIEISVAKSTTSQYEKKKTTSKETFYSLLQITSIYAFIYLLIYLSFFKKKAVVHNLSCANDREKTAFKLTRRNS